MAPPALVLLPVALAGILWGYDRWQAKRGKRPEGRLPVHFGWLFALAFIACLTHPALDWMNTYGIRLLEPFSSRWFYGDVLFIIDVWLWLGMGLGLWLSLRREKRGGDWRKVARVTLAGVLAYIGVNAGVTYAAEMARYDAPYLPGQVAIGSPPPVAFWRRATIVGVPNDWWARNSETGALEPITDRRCAWPDTDTLRQTNSQLDAFLFWSRAPFAMRAEDGSVVLQDARYSGNSTFTLALPDVACEEPAAVD